MLESPEAVAIREKKEKESRKMMLIAGSVGALAFGGFAVWHLSRDAKQALAHSNRPKQPWDVD